MDYIRGIEVRLDPNHDNHVYSMTCADCAAKNIPGEPCLVFECAPGLPAVKCNHILTVFDAERRLRHMFTIPERHEALHKVLDESDVSSSKEFDDVLREFFGF